MWGEVLLFFIRPSSDGMYYGMVMSFRPGLRPSDSPSIRVSVRQFSTLFSNMLWHIELKFCIWLYFTVLQIKCECHQFASISSVVNLRQFLWELCPFWNLKYWKYSFPHFFLTCFDILSFNFAYDFVLLYYRSSVSVVNLRQFLWELCPFWNLEYSKYSFPYFLLHALTYWAEILHMTLFNELYIKFECLHSVSIYFLHFPPKCIDKFSWNLKFDFGFFNAFLLEKY